MEVNEVAPWAAFSHTDFLLFLLIRTIKASSSRSKQLVDMEVLLV
jgi:hypothetical protein